MKDPEFILLKNRFFLAILIIIIFAIPIFFIIKNKILFEDSTIIDKIDKEEKLYIYVEEKNCSNCKEYKKIINDYKINYYSINKSKDKRYEQVISRLAISSDDIISPTLICIENGVVIATLVDINNEEELRTFIENYNISINSGEIE